MKQIEGDIAVLIQVKGLVQGVGFRPFIYRLAREYDVKGWVENRNDGVRIHAEAPYGRLREFLLAVEAEAPAASQIRSVSSQPAERTGYQDFIIKKSEDSSGEVTDISPDIAVCDQCLEDMKLQSHRIDYPFINCTNCGPRFTIIADLPYDREKTTMKVFPMCDTCHVEYTDILDRRFHAQPVACNECGPKYTMHVGDVVHQRLDEILQHVSQGITEGQIIAIKGLGGFHLACDAFNNEATEDLRRRKNRDGKPFAVMFRNIGAVEEFLEVGQQERDALLSWRRPIVILENKTGARPLAYAVSNGFHTTGAMLPYMPFHHLLFRHLQTPAIVLTSGNISEEPILIDNQKARNELAKVTDRFVVYNRDILNRTDDSVLMVVNGGQRMIRRSRGYVPSPIQTGLKTEGIFGAGAELVNCFCIGKGRHALMSQHIGDLKNLETLEFYEESFNRFRKMFRFEPEVLAIDMHPDYLSTKFCRELKNQSADLKITGIQHHHAHIASCMAEHGLDEQVIGVSLDGVGFGTDGNTWGFELMTCDLLDFQRHLHPRYVAQPGGDLATKEPWRMALAYLYQVYGNELERLDLPLLRTVDPDTVDLVTTAIHKGINTPFTCSAGRLFDAVAALTGVCTHSDFHAEAPMRLEQIASPNESKSYPFRIGAVIDTDPLIQGITEDLLKGVSPSVISARFHNAVLDIIVKGCEMIRERTGIRNVVLSGGTFQNRYLLSRIEKMLEDKGFQSFPNRVVPSNDGGIALGQLAIAAKRRSSGIIS